MCLLHRHEMEGVVQMSDTIPKVARGRELHELELLVLPIHTISQYSQCVLKKTASFWKMLQPCWNCSAGLMSKVIRIWI